MIRVIFGSMMLNFKLGLWSLNDVALTSFIVDQSVTSCLSENRENVDHCLPKAIITSCSTVYINYVCIYEA